MTLKKTGFYSAIILLTAFLWGQTACKHEYIENINPVCFESEVLPILVSNCTQSGCHNASDHEKGRDYTNYQGILEDVKPGDFRKSELFKIVARDPNLGGIMPPKPQSPLTADQIETIALWIHQGANNTMDCTSSISCDTASVTFSGSVKPILAGYCNGCHSGSSPSGNISYTNYTGVKTTVDNGTLVKSVEWASGVSAMPKGGSKLSNCQIAILKKWVAVGAPNN